MVAPCAWLAWKYHVKISQEAFNLKKKKFKKNPETNISKLYTSLIEKLMPVTLFAKEFIKTTSNVLRDSEITSQGKSGVR